MTNQTHERAVHAKSSQQETSANNASGSAGGSPASTPAPKTKLEKTQSLLTIVSTAIGLIGVAGSVLSYGAATFYTGTVEVQAHPDTAGVVIKVFTREGHESVFHSKHLELMPGEYHLELSSPEGKLVNVETKVEFHKTNIIPVDFGQATQDVAPPAVAKKKHWWQFWRHNSESEKNNDQEDSKDQKEQ